MISILMPLYNGEEFLPESIGSVVDQTYNKWELLIGVNGKTEQEYNDISGNIKQYDDPRIQPLFCSFKGKCKTLNYLVGQAKYNYICLLDADDYWLPQKLMRQMRYIDKYDVVGTNSTYFENSIGYPGIFLGKLIPLMFCFQNPVITSSVMMKKKLAKWDENWEGLDDYNLWIELVKKEKTFYNIPQVLINHRIHSASYYNNNNEEMHKKIMEEKIPKLTDEQYEKLLEIMKNNAWEL